jgi:hypothetical protein
MSEFYIGYQQHAPFGLRRFLAFVVASLVCSALMIAILLIAGQNPFDRSRFEYLQYRDYDGVIVTDPHPMLLTTKGQFLLVAPGKHGAKILTAGLNLRTVQLKGALIERSGHRMLEVVPASIRNIAGSVTTHTSVPLGSVTVTGEIVDSKCYLGVMNPGSGKVHRSCAARCISGGIPPALLVRDSSGSVQILLLTGLHGRPFPDRIVSHVAEPIKITGQLSRAGQFLTLQTDASTFEHRE